MNDLNWAARVLVEDGEGAEIHLVCICAEEIPSEHDGGSSALVCGVVKDNGVIVALRGPIGRSHERPRTPRVWRLVGKPQCVLRMSVGEGEALRVRIRQQQIAIQSRNELHVRLAEL